MLSVQCVQKLKLQTTSIPFHPEIRELLLGGLDIPTQTHAQVSVELKNPISSDTFIN